MAGALAVATVAAARRPAPRMVTDVLAVSAGALAALAGLSLIDGVAPAEWIGAPVVLALTAFLHVRLLFAGKGPFRT